VLAAYRALAQNDNLPLRVLAAQTLDLEKGADDVPRLAAHRDEFSTGHLRATSAKIFLDGVIESHTAALLTSYLDNPSDRGELNMSPADLTKAIQALDAAGLDVHIHAIGDRAIRTALDALEAGIRRKDARPTLAHIQLIDPADIPRFRRLNVTANFQALWAYADSYITDLTIPFLGPERSRYIYPIKSVVDTGARVAGGSDWSVSSMDPLQAISVALRRLDPDAESGAPFIPEERVDLMTMLRAYTTAGAYLQRHETRVGSLEVGKEADVIVLDRDVFQAPENIHRARVLLTLFAGTPVYRADGVTWPLAPAPRRLPEACQTAPAP
jgi:predicted amidohydrolase YtcJ